MLQESVCCNHLSTRETLKRWARRLSQFSVTMMLFYSVLSDSIFGELYSNRLYLRKSFISRYPMWILHSRKSQVHSSFKSKSQISTFHFWGFLCFSCFFFIWRQKNLLELSFIKVKFILLPSILCHKPSLYKSSRIRAAANEWYIKCFKPRVITSHFSVTL